MSISLGVDTGGTYTDAVIIRDEKDVVASAKSLTTRHDLAIGIGNAVRKALTLANVTPSDVTLASLSTTLATNALIEGQGDRVGLVLAGFSESDLVKHGLADAIGADPVVFLAGGHDHAGHMVVPLDEAGLENWLNEHAEHVASFAVATHFSTRNTEHERRIFEIIRERTGKPVSCSHHLSAKLNGPKRALTAVLNARLIGMIARLITQCQSQLDAFDITAPLMVVRGDGALISAEYAQERPIETILSGPAASIVGARWMTGMDHALVSDIGGTTTDVAILRDGRPAIDPDGARVGPYRTMVEAVAMRTSGLGGDSEVHILKEGLRSGLSLGPRRVLPIALISQEAPDVVMSALESQMNAAAPSENFAQFVRAVPGLSRTGLGQKETTLIERIGDNVQPVRTILTSRREETVLRKLIDRGLVQCSGVTPSDACHVLGTADNWDKNAAELALELFARQKAGDGNRLAVDGKAMAQMIVDRVTHQSSLALLEAAFAQEDDPMEEAPRALAEHILMQKGLEGHRGLVKLDSGLNLPVIGLGASAKTYYPAVGHRLNCPVELPQNAGVANAIGAVVGRVTIRKNATITKPSDGVFRLHLADGPKDFASQDLAMNALEQILRGQAESDAKLAGAEGVQIWVTHEIKSATIEGSDVFVEADMTVEASGRPRIAH